MPGPRDCLMAGTLALTAAFGSAIPGAAISLQDAELGRAGDDDRSIRFEGRRRTFWAHLPPRFRARVRPDAPPL